MGKIVPIANGTATITATFPNGITHACSIKVVTVSVIKTQVVYTMRQGLNLYLHWTSLFRYSDENSSLLASDQFKYTPSYVNYGTPNPDYIQTDFKDTDGTYYIYYKKKPSKAFYAEVNFNIKGDDDSKKLRISVYIDR